MGVGGRHPLIFNIIVLIQKHSPYPPPSKKKEKLSIRRQRGNAIFTYPPPFPRSFFQMFLEASTGEASSVDNIEEKNKTLIKNMHPAKKRELYHILYGNFHRKLF